MLVAVGRKPAEEERLRREATKSTPRAGQTGTPRFAATGAGSMNRVWFQPSPF